MKNIILKTLVLGLILLPAFADAQKKVERNVLSISPFEFFTQTFQLGYERMMNEDNNGLVINAGLTASNLYDDKQMGVKGDVQYRFYFKKNNIEDDRATRIMIFTGPYLAYKYLDREVREYDYDYANLDPNSPVYIQPIEWIRKSQINSVGAGVLFGLRLAMFDKVNIDTFIGGGVKFTDVNSNTKTKNYVYDVTDPEYSGVYPKAGFTVGIKF